MLSPNLVHILSAGLLLTHPVPPAPPSEIVIRVGGHQMITGETVTYAAHAQGFFQQTARNSWTEFDVNGTATFTFDVQARYPEYIDLFDPSRNVHIRIAPAAGKILYGTTGDGLRTLYTITGLDGVGAQAPQPPQTSSSTFVSYSCNEGIPLEVFYEDDGRVSTAVISHDSSPQFTLTQVPSGSGARYTDGFYTLHTKGAQAILTWNGIEDFCTEN